MGLCKHIDCTMEASETNEKDYCALGTNNASNSTVNHKNNFRNTSANSARNFGREVKSVSEWNFPLGTKNKYGFVISCLRQGVGPDTTSGHQDTTIALRPMLSSLPQTKIKLERKSKGKTKQKGDGEITMRDGVNKTMIHPIVIGAEFDKRFLTYEISLGGEIKKDVLLRSLSLSTIPVRNFSKTKEAWEKNHIEKIPDEPSRTKTSSRIGPRYQACMPSRLKDDIGLENIDYSLPGYGKLWDPYLAKEAERRGEDISGFLEGEHELCKVESLMSSLHTNGYSVKAAQRDFERMERFDRLCSSSKLIDHEARQFIDQIHQNQKDFSIIAKNLKRKKSDCLVHYYNWKVTNRAYPSMKKRWNNRYCSVCDDGGNLIICDGCNSNFHMECAKPPLNAVPEGNWFCYSCQQKKQVVASPSSSERRPTKTLFSDSMKMLKPSK